MLRRREGQFGSGQATSASVVIQSAGAVTRCFAARRGKTAPARHVGGWRRIPEARGETARTDRIHREALPRREVEHLALQGEVVARFCSAEDTCPRGTYDLNAEIVEIECSIILVSGLFNIAHTCSLACSPTWQVTLLSLPDWAMVGAETKLK